MDAVIELDNIKKRFGEVEVVKGIDLQIQKGELVSLLGPSGCGKTTTLRMIAGFEAPSDGRVLLHKNDISNVPVRRRNLTMVFQNYALFPHMNVYDNVAFGLNMRKIDKKTIRKKVEFLLDIVKLSGFEERMPAQLSGGQQQRVALARALITEPEVLLLDEPFGALDKKLRETMQLELRNILKKLGITSIFVTHDQEEALVLSDRIVVMNNGKIEQVGTPKETYEYPKTKFVAGFIGISNIFDGTVKLDDRGRKYISCNGVPLYFENNEYQKQQTLIIRPEWIEIQEYGCREENALDGIIQDIKYLGTNVHYYIDAGLSDPIIASNPNTSDASIKMRGDRISVICPCQALRPVAS